MKKKSICLIITTMLIMLISTTSAYAELLGGKWYKSTVYCNIDTNLISRYDMPRYLAMWHWNDVSPNIKLVATDTYSNNYDVLVTTCQDQSLFPDTVKALGIPTLDRNIKGWQEVNLTNYKYGEVRILTSHCNGLSQQPDLEAILTHEFGHILGLAHTEKWFTSSIMDVSDVGDIVKPTSYDIEQLRLLYN